MNIHLWTLPWNFDRPLATGFAILLFCAVMLILRRYSERPWVGAFLDGWLHRLSNNTANERSIKKRQQRFLMYLAILFGLMAGFSFMVATGLIENGPRKGPPEWPTEPTALIEQLNRLDRITLSQYESGELARQAATQPERRVLDSNSYIFVDSWVKMHRERLAEHGVQIQWDPDQQRYTRIDVDTRPATLPSTCSNP